MLNFTKWFFCIYWDGHMVFVLSFMDAVYHTDFAYAEPSLWLWDENDTDLRWKMSDTIPFYLSLLLTHSRFPVCALSLWWGTWHSGKIFPGIERLKSHWMLVKIDSWSIMLSEKGLDQKGEMWKLTKANLTKTDERSEGGALMHTLHSTTTDPNRVVLDTSGRKWPCFIITGRRKETFFLLAWQQLSQWKKSLYFKLTISFSGLFVYNFPFSSIEEFPVFFLLDVHVVCIVMYPKLQLFATPE